MPSESTSSGPFFFMHLQKTAGTALWQRLNDAFEPHELYPGPGDGEPPISTLAVDNLVQRWGARGSEIRVVAGHFPLCVTDLLGGEFTTFSVLREPVERIVSGLGHYRDTEPGMAHASLEEIYDDPLRQLLLRNHMVKMLSLTTAEMTNGAFTEVEFTHERTQRAIEAARGMDVIGVQERFDDFCDTLAQRFGWDLGRPRFANRSSGSEVSAGLRSRITADNEADIELYEVVRTHAI